MSFKAKGIQTVSQILQDLANGLTRTPKDPYYNREKGSIQEKYNLTGVELKTLFTHHQLKGRKVKKEGIVLDIEDDVTPTTEVQETEVVAETKQEETQSVAEEAQPVNEETQEFKGF